MSESKVKFDYTQHPIYILAFGFGAGVATCFAVMSYFIDQNYVSRNTVPICGSEGTLTCSLKNRDNFNKVSFLEAATIETNNIPTLFKKLNFSVSFLLPEFFYDKKNKSAKLIFHYPDNPEAIIASDNLLETPDGMKLKIKEIWIEPQNTFFSIHNKRYVGKIDKVVFDENGSPARIMVSFGIVE